VGGASYFAILAIPGLRSSGAVACRLGRLKMKVKIFERSGEPGRLEREINDFLATLGPGAVLNTQTAIAAVRNENEQIETEYVVTIWYE
jgi:hypothetical protein